MSNPVSIANPCLSGEIGLYPPHGEKVFVKYEIELPVSEEAVIDIQLSRGRWTRIPIEALRLLIAQYDSIQQGAPMHRKANPLAT